MRISCGFWRVKRIRIFDRREKGIPSIVIKPCDDCTLPEPTFFRLKNIRLTRLRAAHFAPFDHKSKIWRYIPSIGSYTVSPRINTAQAINSPTPLSFLLTPGSAENILVLSCFSTSLGIRRIFYDYQAPRWPLVLRVSSINASPCIKRTMESTRVSILPLRSFSLKKFVPLLASIGERKWLGCQELFRIAAKGFSIRKLINWMKIEKRHIISQWSLTNEGDGLHALKKMNIEINSKGSCTEKKCLVRVLA